MKGASANRIDADGAGALAATATSGNLPFTGTALGIALLVALILLTVGMALRRRARRSS